MGLITVDPEHTLEYRGDLRRESIRRESFRLDVDFIAQRQMVSGNSAYNFTAYVEVDWIEMSLFSDDDNLTNYCEIGDIDRLGRICPYKLVPKGHSDYINSPEEIGQIERRLKKIEKEKIGQVDNWAVLVPKTRPYRRVFALVSGKENVYYTTDLLKFQPSEKFIELLHELSGVSFDFQKENDYAQLCVILWFLLRYGPLGNALSAISRWGKTYPTLDPEDITLMNIDSLEISAWIADNYIFERGERMIEYVEQSAEFINRT